MAESAVEVSRMKNFFLWEKKRGGMTNERMDGYDRRLIVLLRSSPLVSASNESKACLYIAKKKGNRRTNTNKRRREIVRWYQERYHPKKRYRSRERDDLGKSLDHPLTAGFRSFTSNLPINEISVWQIKMLSFVELIKGYKMHFLGLNFE
jgi:hypothetical protein